VYVRGMKEGERRWRKEPTTLCGATTHIPSNLISCLISGNRRYNASTGAVADLFLARGTIAYAPTHTHTHTHTHIHMCTVNGVIRTPYTSLFTSHVLFIHVYDASTTVLPQTEDLLFYLALVIACLLFSSLFLFAH